MRRDKEVNKEQQENRDTVGCVYANVQMSPSTGQ